MRTRCSQSKFSPNFLGKITNKRSVLIESSPDTSGDNHTVISLNTIRNAVSLLIQIGHNYGRIWSTTVRDNNSTTFSLGNASHFMVKRALPNIMGKITNTFAESIAQNGAVNRNVSALAPTINVVIPQWTLAQLYHWADAEKV